MSLYTGLLAAPVGTYVGDSTPVVLAGGLVGGAVVGGVLVWDHDPTDWLRGWRVPALAGLPAVWLGPILRGLPASEPAPWAAFLGVAALVPGLLAIALAAHARRRDRLAGATTHVTFTVRPAPGVRRQRKLGVGVVLGMSLLVAVGFPLVLGETISPTDVLWLSPSLPVWFVIFQDSDGREVAVTSEGLRVEQALHDWETFEGYERSDDALRLTRSQWYQSTFAFDTSDIDDPDAVVEALGRYLPPA
ncbi:hypothetical protein GRX03_02020 [Halovenus sp. WSH3]|uniref:DUF5673 domain-containing protein n=1 Tax=Halovenus carboxidivorans TaxID=2692199 RepID=A0A6B0SYE5_9EURY|nr:hypothetical protein [Halovenus carboxidivorans]MXR50385.1 hypothetical protein [Halovenus carboxidivorans]